MRVCLNCGKLAVSNPHGVATCPVCRDVKKKESKKLYNLTHQDQTHVARTKLWRNSDKGKSYQQSDSFKSGQRRYLATEKGKAMVRRRDAKRRGRLMSEDVDLTAEQWVEILDEHGQRCAYCGGGGIMTIDHVIPISRGGKHTMKNIVPACKSCNSSKGDRLIISDGYQMWNMECGTCHKNTMQIVRPGKVQCSECG